MPRISGHGATIWKVMRMTYKDELFTYAHQHAIYVDHAAKGRLIATDRDRLDLLHRLSTNHVNQLAVGAWTYTVFTTAIARIIDRVAVLNRGEEVWLITGEGRGEVIQNWLRRNVFFNDRFQIRSASDSLAHIGIYGAQAENIASQLVADVARLAPNQHLSYNDVVWMRVEGIAGSAGYWVMGAHEAIDTITQQLIARDVPFANTATYDSLRIAAGQPVAGHELTEDYIPLEVGLWDAVSFNKGCYIGQEIIARMESRGKLARMMVQVQLADVVPSGTPLITADGAPAGTLTSMAVTPDGVIGLAVVKSAYANSGEILQAVPESSPTVAVTIQQVAGSYEPQITPTNR